MRFPCRVRRFGEYAIRVLSCTCKALSNSVDLEQRRIATRPLMQLVLYNRANPYVVHVASRTCRPSRAKVPVVAAVPYSSRPLRILAVPFYRWNPPCTPRLS